MLGITGGRLRRTGSSPGRASPLEPEAEASGPAVGAIATSSDLYKLGCDWTRRWHATPPPLVTRRLNQTETVLVIRTREP